MFKFLRRLRYILYYYVLGTFGILEDCLNRRVNQCAVEERTGEVAVVTGGARGIGIWVVKLLLECDMHVIIGCRDVENGKDAVRKLRIFGITTGSTTILPLDMASLDSISNFATAVLKAKPKLHLLINNAGIMFPPFTLTVDGYESQWGVNYLGHFWLSHLLLRRLHKTAQNCVTKIVNISSCAHHAAYPIDFNDINMKKNFITQAAYARSKMAQIMFTQHLNQKLVDAKSNVQVVAVHPGIVNTDLFDGTLLKKLMPWVPGLLFKSPDEGSTSVLYAALHGEGGKYYSNCLPVFVSDVATNKTAQERLFTYSNKVLGISSFGKML